LLRDDKAALPLVLMLLLLFGLPAADHGVAFILFGHATAVTQ